MRKTREFFILVIFISIFISFRAVPASSNNSQNNSLVPADIKFKYLTTAQGLAFNSIKCFCEDQYGFLWIGLEGGLDRYDGNNFLHFSVDPFDSTSLPDPIVEALHLDKKNRLWLGSAVGLTLFSYADMSFKQVDIGLDSVSNNSVIEINETSENGKVVLWLSVLDYGLIKYYPDENISKSFVPQPDNPNSLNDNIIFNIYVDIDGILWLATYRGGLNKFNPVTEKFEHFVVNPGDKNSIPDNHILFVAATQTNGIKTLWLGSGNNGLIKFDTEKQSFEKFCYVDSDRLSISNNRVMNIIEHNGKLLLGTAGGGINVFDIDTHIFQRYLNSNSEGSISSNVIVSAYKSKSGQIFFGTYEKGVSYFDTRPTGFQTIHSDENDERSLSGSSIQCLSRAENGFVFVGHMKGIDIIDESNMSIIKMKDIPVLNTLLTDGFVVSILSSKIEENTIWIGTFRNGIIKYNYETGAYKTYKNNPEDPGTISHNTVSSFCEDSFGHLWFGVAVYGINKLDIASEKITRYSNDINDVKSLSSNYLLSIYEDNQKQIWICTENGLNKYNPVDDNFTRIDFEEEKIHTNAKLIANVIDDPINKDILWIASAAGLIKLNKSSGEYKRFSTKDGLASNLILHLLSHGSSIWMSTVKGISSLNTIDNSIMNYNKSDGIDFEELNLTGLQSQLLYFGATNGIVYFNPDSINNDQVDIEVVLTDFYLFNNKIQPGSNASLDSSVTIKKKLILSYEDYVFGIEFTAPNIKDYSNQSYQYMLVGFHDEWIDASVGSHLATFTNIPPGEYEYRVRAANRMKKWSDYTSITISVTPPFWKTWWAYSFYILFFISSIWSYVQYRSQKLIKEKERLQIAVDERTNELKKLNADKDRFFSIVAHDIKSPLVALVKFTDIFKRQFTILSENEKIESIDEIHKTLSNSYRYLTNLLNWSRIQIGRFEFNPTFISLNELLDKNIQYNEMIAAAKNITIDKQYGDNTTIYADYEMISIVLRNLLSNAIKFTHKNGKIEVRAFSEKEYVQVEVVDYGVGMDKDQVENLFNIDTITKSRGTENEEGTGLGLILCNELVSKNKGEINVISSPGKGSKFCFTIPKTKQ